MCSKSKHIGQEIVLGWQLLNSLFTAFSILRRVAVQNILYKLQSDNVYHHPSYFYLLYTH